MLSTILYEILNFFTRSNKSIPMDSDARYILLWLREYNYCENTYITYRVIVLRFYLWIKYNNLAIDSITRYHLLSYAEFIKSPDPSWCNIHRHKFNHPEWRPFQKALSNKSIYSNLLAIKHMFTYLYNSGEINTNPINFRFKLPKYSYYSFIKQSKYLSLNEFNQIIEIIERLPTSAYKLTDSKIRILWIFKLLFYTGCRRSEIVNSTMNDIKVINHRLWLEVVGKGNKAGLIPIPTELAIALDEYRAYYGLVPLYKRIKDESNIPLIILRKNDNHYSPISSGHLWYVIKSACILLNESVSNPNLKDKISRLSPHWLRHSYATAQVDCGVDLRVVKENMRHCYFETTMKYVHIDSDIRYQITNSNFKNRSCG
jgi:site-specific recombinase XerD